MKLTLTYFLLPTVILTAIGFACVLYIHGFFIFVPEKYQMNNLNNWTVKQLNLEQDKLNCRLYPAFIFNTPKNLKKSHKICQNLSMVKHEKMQQKRFDLLNATTKE